MVIKARVLVTLGRGLVVGRDTSGFWAAGNVSFTDQVGVYRGPYNSDIYTRTYTYVCIYILHVSSVCKSLVGGCYMCV